MSEAQTAIDVAVEFECKKDACRQQQSGEWTLTLKIHPQDVNQELMLAVPGQRYKCFLVALGDNEEPLKPEHVPTTNGVAEAKPKLSWDARTVGNQAGLLCAKNEIFQTWVIDLVFGPRADKASYNEEHAAKAIYEYFDITSRADLDPDKWAKFMAEYFAATQSQAEERA